MEFWQSTSDETMPSPPPQFWSPPPQPSLSSYRNFSHWRTAQGRINPGFGTGCFGQGMGEANESVDMSYDVNPDILRALEEERIREEIIAAEMVRIREVEAAEMVRIREVEAAEMVRIRKLEAEVMEELRMVREMAFRMRGGDAFDRFRVPMESWGMPEAVGNLALSLDQRLRIQGRAETGGMDMLPFQRTNLASKKEKIIFLAKRNGNKRRSRRAGSKPEKSAASYTIGFGVDQQELKAKPRANLSGKKRKLESAGISGVRNKRRKETLKCDLCQVWVTSRVSLNDHLGGKKHKAMEGAMISKPKAGKRRVRKFSSVAKARKMKGEEKLPFWCEMCQVGAHSENVMEAHWNGRKHSKLLNL